MALARTFTGTVSRIKVLTGPVERNSRKMAAASNTMAAVRSGSDKANTQAGTDNIIEIAESHA